MRKSHIVELERHLLSDGGLAIVNRLGRSYSFARTYNSLEVPPDVTLGVTKEEAYALLADTLRDDVCEVL